MLKSALRGIFVAIFASGGLFAADDVKIYIIHGFGANSESYWYPWLKSELSSEVGKKIKAENIIIPDLPTPPTLQAWKDKIKEEVAGQMNERTYFVTHGIGGVATLKFIEESGHKVGGIVLVGGFDKPFQGVQNNIKTFTNALLDYKNLAQHIKHIAVISARDDKSIPYSASEDLADKLNAKFILEQGGRVKANQVGYTSPRIIYSEIRLMIDADNPPPPPADDKAKKK